MSNTTIRCNIRESRSFGFLFAAISILLALYFEYKGYSGYKTKGFFVVGLTFGLIAISAPKFLIPFYRAWMKLGELMGKVISPIILGVIFFMLITPVGIITRLFGRDELRLKKPYSKSCWIERAPPGPSGETFINQY